MNKSVPRDNDACAAILTRNAGTVYRVAYLRVGNRHDAEDVMQDVFVRFVRFSPRFESEEHEKAWFIRATINQTNSFFDRAYKRREIVTAEVPEIREESGGYGRVTEAVMTLPKAQRTAIHLFYYENMTTAEAAAAMGRSETAVRVLLTRGRAKLKELLGDGYVND